MEQESTNRAVNDSVLQEYWQLMKEIAADTFPGVRFTMGLPVSS